jgi:glycosyltransferase involved in cell wall biosynthesis
MRIGFVVYGSLDTPSGGYYYDRRLVGALRGKGDTVEIISLRRRGYAANLLDNMHFRLPSIHGNTGERRESSGHSLDRRPHDIIIQDELNHPSLILANRSSRSFPVVSLVHHLRSSEPRAAWQNAVYRWLEQQYLGTVDGLILNSVTTHRAVHSLSQHGHPALVATPPTDRFGIPLPEGEIMMRTVQPGPLRLVFVGSVTRRKGLPTLLDALNLIPASDWVLKVVGSLAVEPSFALRCQRQAAQLGAGAAVSFLGHLDEDALARELRQAQVLVVPSAYEGYGIAYLEGMGFGLPALATTAGAAREVIREGIDGFLVAPGDAAQLAARILQLHRNRALLLQMSLAARGTHLRQPVWEETVARIRYFLRRVIAEYPCYNPPIGRNVAS